MPPVAESLRLLTAHWFTTVLRARGHAEAAVTAVSVAERIQPFIDAGADWVCPMDYMPLVLDPGEGAAALGRTVELCGAIKGATSRPVMRPQR